MEDAQIPLTWYMTALNTLLDETFERVHGIYLDAGTSLFETLADISAVEASRPVSARCASIAGQVGHVCFYLELAARFVRSDAVGPVDWATSWTITSVTPDEWAALCDRLRTVRATILTISHDPATFANEGAVGGGLGLVTHTAYHLGEIRQALCTIRA